MFEGIGHYGCEQGPTERLAEDAVIDPPRAVGTEEDDAEDEDTDDEEGDGPHQRCRSRFSSVSDTSAPGSSMW